MLPCEINVKYKIPTIKAKLAQKLKKMGYKNKEIAKCLDVTEAAVSQYLHGKRAKSKSKIMKVMKAEKIVEVCKLCGFCSSPKKK
ncbi:MAG: helix-turn-helix domain-containing protein [Candidatus Nanoarchaeia archaeon]